MPLSERKEEAFAQACRSPFWRSVAGGRRKSFTTAARTLVCLAALATCLNRGAPGALISLNMVRAIAARGINHLVGAVAAKPASHAAAHAILITDKVHESVRGV